MERPVPKPKFLSGFCGGLQFLERLLQSGSGFGLEAFAVFAQRSRKFFLRVEKGAPFRARDQYGEAELFPFCLLQKINFKVVAAF